MKCSRCVNDSSVRKISFNEAGVCNFCTAYDNVSAAVHDYDTLESLFRERIDKVRGKYTYDAVVGISGGKDSLFVLHEAVFRYHLKVRAFTLNNGFLSSAAKDTINRIVKEFNIEHDYLEYSHDMLSHFYHYSMKKWLVPCIACSYLGYAAMINYASRCNAGLVIHGRSPEQMFRAYPLDVFSKLIAAGLSHADEVDVNQLYSHLLDSISKKLDHKLMVLARDMLFQDADPDNFREFVPYFLYHRYNEAEIVGFLRDNYGWDPDRNYTHYDCGIARAAKYIYQVAEGRPHMMPEVSVLVRSREISREEGEKMLEENYIRSEPEKEMNQLCSFAGINKKMLLAKARLYRTISRK